LQSQVRPGLDSGRRRLVWAVRGFGQVVAAALGLVCEHVSYSATHESV
jgi:hypothetical protein